MQMVCPECNLTRWFETLPMRLQTCPRCRARGSDTYMTVPSLEVRMPIPKRFAGRTLAEQRRLEAEVPRPANEHAA